MPAVTMTTLPSLGSVSRCTGNPEGARRPDYARLPGTAFTRCSAACGSSRVTSPPCIVRQQGAQDGFDLRGRLALPEDHLGESAAHAAVQVNLGEIAGFLKRADADLVGRLLGSEPPIANGFEQELQIVRIHVRPPDFFVIGCLARFLERFVRRDGPSPAACHVAQSGIGVNSLVTATIVIRNRFELSRMLLRVVHSVAIGIRSGLIDRGRRTRPASTKLGFVLRLAPEGE